MHFQRPLRSALRRAAALTLGLSTFAASGSLAAAQDTPPYHTVPFDFDSGYVSNTTTQEATVISFRVSVPTAPWMRLYFSEVELSGDPDNGSGSILRITSLLDADAQVQNANHVEQWQKSSCYLNGDELLVEVVSQPNTGPNRVVLKYLDAGMVGGPDTICGPTDDRILSQDKRAARLLPIGCTGWMIDDCKSCFLTAGHCSTSSLQTVQFNVPLSNSNGSLVNPPATEQYAVDVSSKLNNGGQGIGNDWGYFGVFPNSNTGLRPFERQLARYHLSVPPTFNASELIRITGYGPIRAPRTRCSRPTTAPGRRSPAPRSSTARTPPAETRVPPWSMSQRRCDRNPHPRRLHLQRRPELGHRREPQQPAGGPGRPRRRVRGQHQLHRRRQQLLHAGSAVLGDRRHGSSSIAANDLTLHANNIGTNKPGLFIYSIAKQNIPFPGGTGRLCVGGGGPIVRLPPLNSGAGTTFLFDVDYNTVPAAGPITAGSVYHFQAWFRTTPGSSETSNGLTISFTS
jgi:hypothetical protein